MGNNFEKYDDAELFEFIKKKHKLADKAFSELYDRHSQRVYAYCKRFLGNKEEAQDVFQETFVKFYQSAEGDREMTNVPAFILRIARNLCVNSKKRDKPLISFEEFMVVNSDDKQDKKELINLIQMAMEILPNDYKEVFILREYEGLSYHEIAEITDLSLTNVKVRIHRAKQKVREILAPYFADLSKY